MSTVKTVTDATFTNEVLGHDGPVLVDFWAKWCGPCRAVSPVLDQIARELSGMMSVVKLDIDENPSTPAEYGITSVPSMLIFHHGDVVKRIFGAKPMPLLRAELADILDP